MVKQLSLTFLLIVLALSGKARATTFWPYPEQCIADPSGRYYVVVKRAGPGDAIVPPVSLTIAERRDGTPPVRSASARRPNGDSFHAAVDPNIRVRDGDIVHGQIALDQPPNKILVSSTGTGIVTLDVYGFNALGPNAGENDAVIYSLKGDLRQRKHRDALFNARQRRGFPLSDGRVHWLGSYWLDEKDDRLIIVTQSSQPQPPPIITVSLTSGEVRDGGVDLIDAAIADRNPHGLTQALDLACGMKLGGSKGSLPGIVDDENLPLSQRLRAAVLLASLGDMRGRDLVSSTVLRGAVAGQGAPGFGQQGEISYAIQHCTELLGAGALPLLKRTLEKNGGACSRALRDAFSSLGARAVPTLIAILENDLNLDAQFEATNCLGCIGPPAEDAVPALIKALHSNATKDLGWTISRLDSHAAWALGSIEKKATAAIPDLEQLANDPAAPEDSRDSAPRALARIK